MKTDKGYRPEELGWMEDIQAGDHCAFEKLFRRYYLLLTRFAWRYVNSKAVAEELVQEIFSELWEDRKELDITESVKAYLYKAVKHRSLNYLKHQKVKLKYDARWMEDKERTATVNFKDREHLEQIRTAIKKAVEELPSRSKMTYKLHRHDGLTYKEIAEVMDVSVKTVESQMTRTLKILRERLAHLLPFILIVVATSMG